MKDGGPAFPTHDRIEDVGPAFLPKAGVDGMSLRDYFAAKAMQGLIQGYAINASLTPGKKIVENDLIANQSYELADSMLAEREK